MVKKKIESLQIFFFTHSLLDESSENGHDDSSDGEGNSTGRGEAGGDTEGCGFGGDASFR